MKKNVGRVREVEDNVRELQDTVEEQMAFYENNVVILKDVCAQLEEERVLSKVLIEKLHLQKKHNLTLLENIAKAKVDEKAFKKSLPRLTKWGVVTTCLSAAGLSYL